MLWVHLQGESEGKSALLVRKGFCRALGVTPEQAELRISFFQESGPSFAQFWGGRAEMWGDFRRRGQE